MLPDSQNLHGEKKEKKLLQYQMKLYYTYTSFSSWEITQAEMLVTKRRAN